MTPDPTPPNDAQLRSRCHGEPALPARLEPWMRELLADSRACADLLDRYGSPVNVHDMGPLARNVGELSDAAREQQVPLRVFVARKSNKTLAVVRAAARLDCGIDVSSERELEQVLREGVEPERIVLTAAMKPRELLRGAVEAGVTIALDSVAEAEATAEEAAVAGRTAAVALRLAPEVDDLIGPTRFGERRATWESWAGSSASVGTRLRIDGVHFHLHGYSAPARTRALGQALQLVDSLRAAGQPVAFIDIGGGVPMSYLEDGADWEAFWREHERALRGEREPLTWRGDGLGLRAVPTTDAEGEGSVRVVGEPALYPYWQELIRGPWLTQVLTTEVAPGVRAADALRERGLELRCEPGRSVLDGCGLTLARVAQVTTTSDDVGIIGLAMNRTQCRSTSEDFLVDPILVPDPDAAPTDTPGTPGSAEPRTGFLLGAYCIEADLILRRRLTFPGGVAPGDMIALPNTGGYLMHILESASHQIPLAANVVRSSDGSVRRDGIDEVSPLR
ncbi:alanine racemase [Brachybacterium sp. EF45031]|uniref:alanine racemase n=1 Tax=Brachybacterium sillae TaxID=2810536 RepID=UPI00217CE736|nr:alanine racemase [Brachybacterium sillae]MCS6711751.1 alanine racemase [Brachybacterium sillae]